MKNLLVFFLTILLSLSVSAQKKKWVNLFDGKSTAGWHIWNQTDVKGWHVMGGALMTHGGNGDLVSDQEYGDFILEFEFKVAPKGNSGVIYKVLEDHANKDLFASYASGPEYQIIDDAGYPGKITDKQKTGANYDIQPPRDLNAVKPADQWNSGKIQIKENRVTHWLNGIKVADYEYGSVKWDDDVAGSKFAKWPYAKAHTKGKIALQDHGDMVSFRKIRIKEL
ncbi:MAG: DUF1080 domain-containing protein [Cytophagaceae bacterium]|nr:DUF1080 domain-containing protein [Cytophagaceae bacterium]